MGALASLVPLYSAAWCSAFRVLDMASKLVVNCVAFALVAMRTKADEAAAWTECKRNLLTSRVTNADAGLRFVTEAGREAGQ